MTVQGEVFDLRLAGPVMDRLRRHHLAASKETEALSFVLGRSFRTATGGVRVLVPHTAPVFLPAPDCYLRATAANVQLAPLVLNALLVAFARSDLDVWISVHDHWWADRTEFSPVDDADDLRFDAYLRERFEPMLRAHPELGLPREVKHVALVLGREGVDARLVDGRRDSPFRRAAHVDVIGARYERLAVGAAPRQFLPRPEHVRQRDFVLPLQQALLAEIEVAVVACGGIGSILAEELARLGVGRLLLVDHDRVERSNLNRLQGATPGWVGRSKATVLARGLRRMFPEIGVRAVPRSVFAPGVERLLASADLIVAGLDDDPARSFLSRLAVAYGVPYWDAATAVVGAGESFDLQARVFAVLPGTTACLACSPFRLHDPSAVIAAYLDEVTAHHRRAAGYVVERPEVSAPSVYPLNQRAAALLCIELLNWICGWRPAAATCFESWRSGQLQRTAGASALQGPAADCPVCGFHAGAGESELIPRPRVHGTRAARRSSSRHPQQET